MDGTTVTGNGMAVRYSWSPVTWAVCSYVPERSSNTVSEGWSQGSGVFRECPYLS